MGWERVQLLRKRSHSKQKHKGKPLGGKADSITENQEQSRVVIFLSALRRRYSAFIKYLSEWIMNKYKGLLLFSHVQLFATPWTAAYQAPLSSTISWSSLRFMSSSRWCQPTISSSVVPFSSCLQSFSTSGSFEKESAPPNRWPKYWSFCFSISPSNEHPGLISFRMDWVDLLAVQGTLKSLLQHHRSKHQFFGAQLSLESNSHIHKWPLEKP